MSATLQLINLIQSKGLRYVGTRGNPHAPVAVIGEAPGADEDQYGLPFVGASGRLQDKMMSEAGLLQSDCWFTNPFKVRPPDNKLDRLPELSIPYSAFINQFMEELEFYKPTFLLTCGRTPTNLLCPFTKPKKRGVKDDKKEGFGKWRGSLLRSPLLSWEHYVIPIYHPAFILRNWAERQTSVLIYSKAKEELQYWKQTTKLRPLPIRHIMADPSYDQVINYLLDIATNAKTRAVAVDTELLWFRKTRKKFLNIIGFAKSPWDALAFCVWDFAGEQLERILRLVNYILQTCQQIGQNYTTFDCHWLRTLGLRPNLDKVDDTLIRHHVLWPELEHTLAFMTLQYTRQPYYKDQGKVWPAGRANMTQLRNYCGLDCCVTYEVFNEQEREFQCGA